MTDQTISLFCYCRDRAKGLFFALFGVLARRPRFLPRFRALVDLGLRYAYDLFCEFAESLKCRFRLRCFCFFHCLRTAIVVRVIVSVAGTIASDSRVYVGFFSMLCSILGFALPYTGLGCLGGRLTGGYCIAAAFILFGFCIVSLWHGLDILSYRWRERACVTSTMCFMKVKLVMLSVSDGFVGAVRNRWPRLSGRPPPRTASNSDGTQK